MSYSNMFDSISSEPPKRESLFGDDSKKDELNKIQDWCNKNNIKLSPNRVAFHLNGIEKIESSQFAVLGDFQLKMSSELNKLVETLTLDLVDMNKTLDDYKTWFRESIEKIEEVVSPKEKFSINRFVGFFKKEEEFDFSKFFKEMSTKTSFLDHFIKMYLKPFIDKTKDGVASAESILRGFDEIMVAIDYLKSNSDDAGKDVCNKKKDLFQKSYMISNMSKKQLGDLNKIAVDNETMFHEMEVNVVPLVGNLCRSVMIGKINGTKDISEIVSKMNGVLR